jgi:fumarate reductase (CoM/CoB) subunit A
MNSKVLEPPLIETDVLIVGSGAAGLRAAIEAKSYGANVILVDKLVIGYNNSSSFARGFIKAALPGMMDETSASQYITPNITPKKHFIDIVEYGAYVNNQRLVEVMVLEAPGRVLELQEFGVQNPAVLRNSNPPRSGISLTKPLNETCAKLSVRRIPGMMVSDLLVQDGVVVGALAIDTISSKPVILQSKTTILATGGVGEVYERNYTTQGSTGDGCALAYRIGAEIIDPEFIMFGAFVTCEEDLPMWYIPPCEARWHAILRNRKGEEFISRYLEMKNPEGKTFQQKYGVSAGDIRELLARWSCMEVVAGRGDRGAIHLDFTKVGDEVWNLDEESKYLRTCQMREWDMRDRPLRVLPGVVVTLGGVRINEWCETNVQGLFATGEASGLVHGAGRRGGNALTECIVFGARAGRRAADTAGHMRKVHPNQELIKQKIKGLIQILNRQPSEDGDPGLIRSFIQAVMWENVGPLRDAERLEKAIHILQEIRQKRLPKIFAKTLLKLRKALETINLLYNAEMIAHAAIYRTESRGPTHYRLDFPVSDNKNWLKNIIIKNEGDSMKLWTEPIVVTTLTPPDSL